MCGIAGYSLSAASRVDRTLAGRALLAAIAERGADAAGYAYRLPGESVVVHKQRTGASALLEVVDVPAAATEALFHVRDYTKGHPSLLANNHPIRHGAIVGVHNGIIENDEELFQQHGFRHHEPGMTVDSEAIFALAEETGDSPKALEELHGSMATAWIDERDERHLFVARGVKRPLWIAEGGAETFFASTPEALELVGDYTGVDADIREVPEGTFLALAAGRIELERPFRPDHSFVESNPLPAVRAPHERHSALAVLASIAAPSRAR